MPSGKHAVATAQGSTAATAGKGAVRVIAANLGTWAPVITACFDVVAIN